MNFAAAKFNADVLENRKSAEALPYPLSETTLSCGVSSAAAGVI